MKKRNEDHFISSEDRGVVQKSKQDVAIVGVACRFPGANNCDEFWENLKNGKSSISEIPSDRWNIDKHYSPNIEVTNKSVSKWGGFIDNFDYFDAAFFCISPHEAELMDPQQRIMLELALECFEDAGYASKDYSGTATGVYIGACSADYRTLLEASQSTVDAHISTGTHYTLIPNRVSFFF
jgi:acyl transferase domain-containing protein